jgi:TPR repeat protein
MPNYYERNLNNDYSSDAFCMRSTAIGEVKRDVARGTEYLRRAAAQKHGIASRMLLRYTPQDGTVATFLKKLLAVLQA